MPDLVVSLGSAGSVTLERTKVYQVGSVAWRDMDASVPGVEKGVKPFLGCLLNCICLFSVRICRLHVFITGGNIFSRKDYQTLDADMVDMETYAVLRACQHFGVPLIGLRDIADGWDDLHHMDDWKQYLHIIGKKNGFCCYNAEEQAGAGKRLTFL